MPDETKPPAEETTSQKLPVTAHENVAGQSSLHPAQSVDNKIPRMPLPGKTASSQLEERKEELAQELNDIENEVIVADEWGIFNDRLPGTDDRQPPDIYKVLAPAHKALADGNIEAAEIALLNVRALLNRAQDANSIWQINNRFGLLPILLTALSALVTYDLVFWWWFGLGGTKVIEHAAFAGMVGAVLRSLYWLQFQTNNGLFRPRWFASFIVAPPVGAILGWLVSLLITASVQAVTVSKDLVNTDWRTISLLAAFAGFNWEWALGILEETAKSILARIKEKPPDRAKR